jgi:serine/threonine-protein kinase
MPDTPSTRDFPSPTLVPGALLDGRYRLERVIGSGGMAEVWAATHEALGRTVAVKVVHAMAPSVGDRLRAEARTLAVLTHPNIVGVFDAGLIPQGLPYVVLEYVAGVSVGDRLARSRSLPSSEAVALMIGVSDGLAAAHDMGIIHRDVKPSNILVAQTSTGPIAKLADFGIAFLLDSRGVRQTRAGTLVGTPAYMSPEQLRGERAGPRSDIWAASVSLYEMLAGRLPFESDDLNALVIEVLRKEPARPPSEVVDDHLWTILRRGMAKDPADRFPNAQALSEALRAWRAPVRPITFWDLDDEEDGNLDALIRKKLT